MKIKVVEKGNCPRTFIISNEDLEKILSIKSKPTMRRWDKNLSTDSLEETSEHEIEFHDFFHLVSSIVERIDSFCMYGIQDDTFQPKSRTLFDSLIKRYLSKRGDVSEYNYFDYKKIKDDKREFLSLLLKEDTVSIEAFLDLCIEISQLGFHVYKLLDIYRYRDSLFENLHYFLSKEDREKYENLFDELYEKEDIPGLVSLIDEMHGLIINHWKDFISDVSEIKPGQPFAFIGHSRPCCSTFVGNKFEDRFISCSLFTPNLTETYRDGYGFMFGADDIVAASYKDTYTNNQASSEEEMLTTTSVPHIETPEYILGRCMALKQENEREHKNRPVYNEVVVGNFKPIGIFCFTDGSKGLNDNYNAAKKLHEQFPELPFVEIDVTLYNNDKSYLTKLIWNIRYKKDGQAGYIGDISTKGFDLFHEEFMELKQSGNYDEEDIIALYEKHQKLLFSTWDLEDAIKQDIPVEKLRYFLLHNYQLRLEYIFSGEGTLWMFNDLYKSLERMGNADKLDQALPGVRAFLDLMGMITLTKEMVDEINKNKSVDFNVINQVLKKYVLNQRNSLELELQAAQDELSSIEIELSLKKERLKKLKEAESIQLVQLSYKWDRDSIEEKQNEIEIEQEKQLILIYEQQQLENEKLEMEKAKADEERRLFKRKEIIDELEGRLFDIKQQLEFIKWKLESVDRTIVFCTESIQNIRRNFQESSQISFDEFPSLLAAAQTLLEGVNIVDEEFAIYDLEKKLEEVKERVKQLEQKIKNLNLGGNQL